MGRWIRFIITIGIGIVAGLIYGWLINPVEYVNTAPDSLRKDYRTDYVLMVAEAYHTENSLSLAARRLAMLGDQAPEEIVTQAITYASQIHYSDSDLELMQTLADKLKTWDPSQEPPP